MNLFRRFLRDETGATAIEYALIAALMAVAVITGIGFLSDDLETAFTNIGNCLANTSTCASVQ